jgi:hypothetical protein
MTPQASQLDSWRGLSEQTPLIINGCRDNRAPIRDQRVGAFYLCDRVTKLKWRKAKPLTLALASVFAICSNSRARPCESPARRDLVDCNSETGSAPAGRKIVTVTDSLGLESFTISRARYQYHCYRPLDRRPEVRFAPERLVGNVCEPKSCVPGKERSNYPENSTAADRGNAAEIKTWLFQR